MIKFILVTLLLIFLNACPCFSQSIPVSKYFILQNWKLQVPGPTEIKDLINYSSSYFYLDADTSICLQLDASEKGHTRNSEFVRCELRHLSNWGIGENHWLSALIKLNSDISEYQVTVMQIHGITVLQENAPPLLRIALVNGDLYAFLKSDSAGNRTEKILLKTSVSNSWFHVSIQNEGRYLDISVDNRPCLHRNIDYWKFKNYFKLGCYPQIKTGKLKMNIKSFEVR